MDLFPDPKKTLFMLLMLCTAFQVSRQSASFRLTEKKILDTILGESTYDSRIRPSGLSLNVTGEDIDGPAIVRVNLYVRSISRIDDVQMEYAIQITFREEWRDSRLEYDDMNGRIRFLTLTDPDKIWKPDLFFSNEKEGHFHNIIMPNVLLRIYPNGDILFSVRISLVLFCPMNLKFFPLDLQTCTIKMASYGYTTEDLVFLWKEGDPVQVTGQLHLSRFTLLNYLTEYCTSRTNTGEYSCIKVDMLFKREFSYYLILIYVPCCMLVIVSWVSFWVDPNSSAARVLLGVTSLLTMSRQINSINASLPPVSYTKAVDVWTGACLAFVFSALLEFAVVNYVSRQDAHRADRKRKLGLNGSKKGRRNKKWETENKNGGGKDSGCESEENESDDLMMMGGGSGSGPSGRVSLDNGRNGFNGLNGNGTTARRNGSLAQAVMNRAAAGDMGPPPFMDDSLDYAPFPKPRKIPPPNVRQNFVRQWLNRFPTRSKKVDIISRVAFPMLFAIFNLFYWVTYLWRDDLKDLDI